MTRKSIFLLALSAAMAVPALAADTPAPNLDDIIAKHVQAVGGMEKLNAVKTQKISGKMTLGQGMEAPIVMYKKRPDEVRMEFTLQGLTGVQAYDGKTGWHIMPFQGKKDAQPMGEDEMKDIKENADFEGDELIDYKTKGNKVEYVDKEPVEGSDTYKLKVTLPDGTVLEDYLDTDSYLVVKQVSTRTIRGTEHEIDATIGDYKDEGGLMLPHSVQQAEKGSDQPPQNITLDKYEFNVPVDDAIFKMPPPPPAAATPAPPKKDDSKDEKKPEVKK